MLQLGRYRDALATVDVLAPMVKASGQLKLLSDLSSMRARYVIEAADWALMANENNFGNANELFAIGISAANSGGAERAERVRQGLAERAQDPREGDLRPAIAIMEREVAAVIAHAAGRADEAVRMLTEAAQQESQLPAPLGLPAPIKPAPELLGEVLLALGRAREAVPFFEQALRAQSQPLAIGGRARARRGRGRRCRRCAPALHRALENFKEADADLPLLREARSAARPDRASARGAAPGCVRLYGRRSVAAALATPAPRVEPRAGDRDAAKAGDNGLTASCKADCTQAECAAEKRVRPRVMV